MTHPSLALPRVWVAALTAVGWFAVFTMTGHAAPPIERGKSPLPVVPSAASRFAGAESQVVPDFQRHIVPLLGRLGCNSAKCHGSFQGQGGFRLSLFGFDFRADHAALRGAATSADGMRINLRRPDQSLILLKPTGQMDHEGGKRLAVGSWEHHLLRRWIETGAKGAVYEPEKRGAPGSGPEFGAAALKFFDTRIRPLLEDNCYECHGRGRPKAGLALTTRESVLEGGDSGPAIVPGKPDESRLIHAVEYGDEDLRMPPSGKLSTSQIRDLRRWVETGAPWPPNYDPRAAGDTSQVLVRLHAEPAEIVFQRAGETARIKVVAEWQSGVREDVTCLTRFQTNNDAIVTVDSRGSAKSGGGGDTHIVAYYDNGVVAIPVIRPFGKAAHEAVKPSPKAARERRHPIDRFVTAKLDKLGITPSPLCTDAEFLRRVSIDMTGTLPTPDEVEKFIADKTPGKRERKVDELLKRPAYAAWWTNKLCDFTGCSPVAIRSLLEVAQEQGYVKASQWYDWIYARVARNEPYDKLVAGIMLADLSSPVADGMPHFWTRQSLKEPKDTAMSVAHSFLGIQLQCAECHKHPFDRWTQADFTDFARLFESVTTTKRRSTVAKPQRLRLLRGTTVSLEPGDDPRRPVLQWMRHPDNPWFARAFVNRVWAGYFNVGIVDPPDRFTPANPPSNPELLDWLSRGFIESGYDMKWLHRQIATSRTYQRSWKPNATNRHDRRNFSRAIPRRLPAEVVYDAMKQATAATDKLQAVRVDLKRRASGHLSMRMAGTHAMKVFGKPNRTINCDCERVNEPTLLQAIFVQNDPLVRMRIADSGWVIEIEDAESERRPLDQHLLIHQAWLRTVGRLPTAKEIARARAHLDSANSVASGIGDLLWALLNTKEFLLNH